MLRVFPAAFSHLPAPSLRAFNPVFAAVLGVVRSGSRCREEAPPVAGWHGAGRRREVRWDAGTGLQPPTAEGCALPRAGSDSHRIRLLADVGDADLFR